MTALAPHPTAFFQQRLPVERRASSHTSDSYAYAFKLLLAFASERLHVSPSALSLEEIDAPLVVSFLHDLETRRANRPSSRNVRLAAIKSFMHFVEFREPSAIEQIQRILAIPPKKAETRLVRHLTVEEMQAILHAPEPSSRDGLRDRAMLHLCFAGGLRVSELVGLQLRDLTLQPQPSILVHGKGRRERSLPLWKVTATALRAWLAVRGPGATTEVFVNARGQPLTRAGFEYILAKHVQTATASCPSLSTKHVSPHVLRHYLSCLTMSGDTGRRSIQSGRFRSRRGYCDRIARHSLVSPLSALQAVEEPEELVAGVIACRPAVGRCGLGERLLFHRECGLQIDLRRLH